MKKHRNGKRKTDEEHWDGGYMAAKISKLQKQFKDEAGIERKGIFSGIAIFVNGYTEPAAAELKQIMMKHGGVYHHYHSKSQTTHIIASNLPDSKIKSLDTDRIVGPKWISDSLEAGKLLDYKNYLLYTNINKSQPKLRLPMISEVKVFPPNDCFDVKDESMDVSSSYGVSGIEYNNFDETFPCSSKTHVNASSSFQEEMELDSEASSEANSESKSSIRTEKMDRNSSLTNTASKRNSLNTSNPNFLSEFYINSRLHHISTSGAMFKQYVKDIQTRDHFSGISYFKNWLTKQQLTELESNTLVSTSKVVMHIDMDCFFVSVGLRNHPELVNKPVAVTHATKNSIPKRDKSNFDKEVSYIIKKKNLAIDTLKQGSVNKGEKSMHESDTSKIDIEDAKKETNTKSTFSLIDEKCSMAEIASCSYKAREKGVKNGMFLGVALKLCPELKTIPYDFEGYKAVSMDLYDIVSSYTKNIEAVSCDELLVDLEDILKECHSSPLLLAKCIREQIQEKTKCPCSVGMGPNMLTARMATRKAKPNGQFLVEASQIQEFMKDQPVSDLPGVGSSMKRRLENEGVSTCADLQSLNLGHLQSTFGQCTGKSLYDFCRGIDERPINKDHQRKSVSAEVNYGIRFQTSSDAEKFLSDLSQEVAARLTKIALKGKTITLKLKVRAKDAPAETAKFMGHGVCDNVAKSITLSHLTDDEQKIFRESVSLLKQVSIHPKELRGVGIQVSKLAPASTSSSSSSSSSIRSFLSSAKPPSHSDVTRRNKPDIGSASGGSTSSGEALEAQNQGASTSTSAGANPHASVKRGSLKAFFGESSKDTTTPKDTAKTLDVEVLSSLPPELREEVIKEYESQGYLVPASSMPASELPLPQESPRPGPSKLSSYRPEEEEERAEAGEDQKTDLQDLSFSQIDSSFLNALPYDVREDLKKEFEAKKNSSARGTPTPTHVTLPTAVPTAKKKRGRPRGSCNKGGKRKASPKKPSEYRERSSNVLQVQVMDEEFQVVQSKDVKDFESISTDALKVPTLCEQYLVDDIKSLISQWITACPSPQSIDVKILTEFFTDLVKDKDLEKLELLLKFMKRKMKSGSLEWQNSFELILNTVQNCVTETCHAPLQFIRCLVQESN